MIVPDTILKITEWTLLRHPQQLELNLKFLKIKNKKLLQQHTLMICLRKIKKRNCCGKVMKGDNTWTTWPRKFKQGKLLVRTSWFGTQYIALLTLYHHSKSQLKRMVVVITELHIKIVITTAVTSNRIKILVNNVHLQPNSDKPLITIISQTCRYRESLKLQVRITHTTAGLKGTRKIWIAVACMMF